MAGLCPRNRVRSILDSWVEAYDYAFDVTTIVRDDKVEFVFNFRDYVLSIVPKPPYDYVPLTYGLALQRWVYGNGSRNAGGVV